jgi:hypothetical protein
VASLPTDLSISSYQPQPTSAIHSSEVPGRSVNRKGLRSPVATMRRAPALGEPISGFPGIGAPVSGSTRMIDPSGDVGSPSVRTSCERSIPPSAVWGTIVPPTPTGASPHGFRGMPCWP